VIKTRRREVVTLEHGPFEAWEHLARCDRGQPTGTCPTVGSRELARLVPPGQRFGYDLLVHTGLARYLHDKQRTEIQADLHGRGIELSAGTISNLCDQFLSRLEALHLLRAPYLRAAMSSGWALHLDATCDAGRGGLFACMEGLRGWVLMVERVTTESGEELTPVVQRTVELFGDPLATMRDMGKGMEAAVAPLRKRGILDLICHYHFLRAVGTALLGIAYDMVRSLLRVSEARSGLNQLVRELRDHRAECADGAGSLGAGPIREELRALVQWLSQGDGARDALFPFGLPHVEFVRRCHEVPATVQRLVSRPRTTPEQRAIKRLLSIVRKVDKDPRMARALGEIQRAERVFDELRDVLRLGHSEQVLRPSQQPLPAAELLRLQQIEAGVGELVRELKARAGADARRKRPKTPEGLALKYLARERVHLFGHPVIRDEQGHLVAIVGRTNNALEQTFGAGKRHMRRRLGHARLAHDMEQQPPQVLLVGNLRHPDYVRLLCGSIDHLPEALAQLDVAAVNGVDLRPDTNRQSTRRQIKALLERLPAPEPGRNQQSDAANATGS
jgi:hypothetical protein